MPPREFRRVRLGEVRDWLDLGWTVVATTYYGDHDISVLITRGPAEPAEVAKEDR